MFDSEVSGLFRENRFLFVERDIAHEFFFLILQGMHIFKNLFK